MSTSATPEVAASDSSSRRHHQFIITLFGLYARQYGGELQISAIISLMKNVGVEAAGVRSTMSRLKKRGIFSSSKVNGRSAYALSSSALTGFADGDERIFHPRRANATDRWLLATFSVPESRRNIRHQIRSMLVRMGFGVVSPGLWIAPEHMKEEALAQFARHDLTDYFEFFLAEHLGVTELSKNIGQWWELETLDAMYAQFLEQYRPVLADWESFNLKDSNDESDATAFSVHLRLLTEWRRLPYSDPGLPVEFLPDGWSAIEATALFQRLHGILGPAAQRHAHRVIDAHLNGTHL